MGLPLFQLWVGVRCSPKALTPWLRQNSHERAQRAFLGPAAASALATHWANDGLVSWSAKAPAAHSGPQEGHWDVKGAWDKQGHPPLLPSRLATQPWDLTPGFLQPGAEA